MNDATLMNAHVQAKRIYSLLNEVMDLSRQMAEAVDRDDQVAIQMLVSMREEPVRRLRQARLALKEQRDALAPEESAGLSRLLNGGAAETGAEQPLADQIAINRRLLEQVLELDKILNRKLTREDSVYK